jgi:hypothetical protein
MQKFLLNLGGLLFFSRRHQSVRKSIIFLLANFLMLAAIIFTVEIILIFCGVGNIFLPFTQKIWAFLLKLL